MSVSVVPSNPRRLVRAAAITLGSVGLVVLTGTAASAHVTVTPSTTSAGAYSVLTFSASHGCEESPTTTMTFQVPEGIFAVAPTVNPGWTIEKVMEKLDTPVDDGHGGTYTERVARVVYTAKTPLPDGYRDTFELSVKLPEKEGERLLFPVVQACEEGENAWVQESEKGQDEPESPAPFLELTAADAADHHGAASADEDAESDHAASESSDSSALGWIGVVLGALGLGVGGVALARSGKRA